MVEKLQKNQNLPGKAPNAAIFSKETKFPAKSTFSLGTLPSNQEILPRSAPDRRQKSSRFSQFQTPAGGKIYFHFPVSVL
ncbi:MAG: hypothetical protein HFF39_04230 [Lawsonibacter sp.]|nr:hypothetical protein [Lawsonibacter sp.]